MRCTHPIRPRRFCCSAPRNWRRSPPSTPSPIGRHLRSAFADGACQRQVAWRKAWNFSRKPWPTSAPLGLSPVFHSFLPCLRALLGTQVGLQKGSSSSMRRCGKSRQPKECWSESDLHRVRGELLIAVGDAGVAEASIKQSKLHVGRAQNCLNCAPLPALPVSGAIRTSAPKPGLYSLQFTIGSPKVSTRRFLRTPRRFSTS